MGNRNKSKVTDKRGLRRTAPLSQQRPSRKLSAGIQWRSSPPSMVFKDEGTRLRTLQSPTSPSERSQQFGTLCDFCSGLHNPQTPQHCRRKTQTEMQAWTKDFSQICYQEQTHLNTPLFPQYNTLLLSQVQVKDITKKNLATEGNGKLLFQSQEKEYRDKSGEKFPFRGKGGQSKTHSRKTECRINQSHSELTASFSKSFREKRVRPQGDENTVETVGKNVDEFLQKV